MADITSIIIVWSLVTGISILVSSAMLYKRRTELKKLESSAIMAEQELANYIDSISAEELNQTESGRELLQLLELKPKTTNEMSRKQKGITERHIRILEFLADYQNNHGRPPSIREISEKIKISATSTVNHYLDQLEKMGYLERDDSVARGIRLTDKVSEIIQVASDMLRVPILGPIAAGPLMLVPEPGVNYMNEKEYDAVDVARSLLPSKEKGNDLYALEVKGDSMIDAMINDGDIIIMKPDTKAKNGEMVAVRVNDEYTLKYFFSEKDRYRLQPANPTMKPIFLKKNDPVEINGKVVMVIRRMDRSLTT